MTISLEGSPQISGSSPNSFPLHTVLLALPPAVPHLPLTLAPHAPAIPRDLQLPEDSIDSVHVAPAAWMPPPFFLPLLLASLYGDTQVSHQFL